MLFNSLVIILGGALPSAVCAEVFRVGKLRDAGSKLDGSLHEARAARDAATAHARRLGPACCP